MTLKKYILGFVLSLGLTLLSYYTVMAGGEARLILSIILVLAGIQMIIQLVFFLHLGDESSDKQKNAAFGFMVGTLLIVFVGSLWALSNMNYNMMQMSPVQKENYMFNKSE